MIRFGKNFKNDRKDVLATVKQDDYIYFGIARCNLKVGDKFDRELGKKIAKARAEKAIKISKLPEFETEPDGFDISAERDFYPFGRVKADQVKSLLSYFHSFGR